MKIKILGAGSAYCKHPLVTSSFLVQTETSNIVIGVGPNIPAKLSAIGLEIDDIDMWVPLHTRAEQSGGLEEVAATATKKPYVVAPNQVISEISKILGTSFSSAYEKKVGLKSALKIHINEEHYSEILTFIPNHFKSQQSFSVLFETAQVMISGDTALNEDFIERHGMACEVILHTCVTDSKSSFEENAGLAELQTLPVYLQKRIWLYGYGNNYLNVEDPLPMLFIPQGHIVYDSQRKDPWIRKDKFIRDEGRRQLGNRSAS